MELNDIPLIMNGVTDISISENTKNNENKYIDM